MGKWSFYTANEVKPSGWLLRQLRIQAAGLCGHLDQIWPDVRDSAWIGGDREGWERVPYWLDGFIPLAYLLEDEDMTARAKRYMDAILALQQEDGWICPCMEEEREAYDTWAVALISKVMVVYYECSRDPRVPDALYRVLKNYYDLLNAGRIRLFDWGKARWFEPMIAIAFTYERRPEAWLRELAAILKDQGTDYLSLAELWKRPLNWWRQETHIVNLAMMFKYEAVSCELLGLPYEDRAEEVYRILRNHNGTPVETFTGDECLSGLSPIQGTELCAVAEQMYSYELLYAYTGDPKWAERLEVLAFNALPATISGDMWTHQYVQMSNQIACMRFPGRSQFRTNGAEAHLFGLEPNYGCCTANFGQAWPKFVLSAFLYHGDTVLHAVPVPEKLETDQQIIEVETDYPFGNRFAYHVDARAAFTLRIRIPSFAKNVTVNGVAAESAGKIAIDRSMQPISDLAFTFRAGETVNFTVSYDTEAKLSERPYGLYTARKGSLVFSVPISYKKRMHEYERDGVIRKYPYCDYELLPCSSWNYAYGSSALTAEFRSVGNIPFSEEEPPVILKAAVKPIPWGLEEGFETVCAKIPELLEPAGEAQEIELWPYGCAKLRMTELPFIP